MRSVSRWLPIIGGAIAGGVIALIIASSSTSTKTVTTTVVQQGSSSTSAEPTSFKSGTGLSINQIYKAASPGVVDIKVTAQSSNQGFGFFGGGQSGVTEGEGAGVVYNTKGDILTDEHVVANATSVQVNFQDGKSVPAKVVGTDPSTDVAVIHVEVPTSELHPIPLADSSQAQVGDPVVAIGSPFSLPETTTTGIVSQTGRSIQAPNQYTIPDAIQTDAAINPGNSGGPLLDADGHVLGLNDQIETNNQTAGGEGSSSGVGFAVPSDTVKQVADEIIAGHKVEHSFVGVSLPAGGGSSAKILQIKSNSPASRADLQVGDVVSAINGTPITTSDAFIATIDKYKPGQKVTLSIQRSGQTKQIQVTLAQRPAQTPSGG